MAEEPITPNPGEPIPEPIKPDTPDPAVKVEPEPKPQSDSDWYWKRQAEKAKENEEKITKERDALAVKAKELEDANLTEQQRKEREAEEAKGEVSKLKREKDRLAAIIEAQLIPELAELVPEGIEDPKTYIEEKIMPLREKLVPKAFGNPTMPGKVDIPDSDDQAYETFKVLQATGKDVQGFWNQNHEAIKRAMTKVKG